MNKIVGIDLGTSNLLTFYNSPVGGEPRESGIRRNFSEGGQNNFIYN